METFDPLHPAQWFGSRVALVTGASSGIGHTIALALGAAGARVGVHYRNNAAAAAELVERINGLGGQAVVLQADVSRADQVEAMFGGIEQHFGEPPEMLVCSAGDWMDKSSIVELPEAQWDRMFDVNARSVFLCCQQAARRMVPRRSGAIITFGSVAGHTGGGGGTVPYAAAKAAVHTFTRGLARELAPHGVRVNCVLPGMIDTPMLAGRVSPEGMQDLLAATPMGRMGQAHDIAPLVLTLLSPAGSFVTGQVIEVNGGLLMR